MIITLAGENDFGRSQALAALGDKFVAEFGDLALEKIDGEEAEFARISEALTSLPFLASRKLVVFKNPSASKDFQEKFELLLENLPETTELVLVEARLDKRTSLYKFLKKSTDYREYNPLDASALAIWLVNRAKELEGEISAGDARYLVERAGENQQKLASELEKLLTFNKKITRDNIEKLVALAPRNRAFLMLEAALNSNKKEALKIYRELRQLGEPDQKIIGMMSWQLHLLALVKSAGKKTKVEIASEARISPYSVDGALKLARGIELADVRRYVNDLLELDRKLKSTAMDSGEALETYLLEL